MRVPSRKYSIQGVERTISIAATFAMIFLPILWGIGFSYRLYGDHPWPGVAIYAHLGLLSIIILFFINYRNFLKIELFNSILFFIYLLLSVLISFIFYVLSTEHYKADAVVQALISSFYMLGYFIVGFYVFKFRWPKLILLFVFFVFAFLSIVEYQHGSAIPVSLYTIYGSFSDVLPNYQLVSLSILFLGLLILRSNIKFKSLIFFSCFVMVYLTGGRSEFFGSAITLVYIYLLILLVVFLKRFSLHRNQVNIFIVVFLTAIVLFSYIGKNSDTLNNRNFQILELDKASSWVARENIKKNNSKFIYDSPVLGSFGSHFSMGKGSYTHNWISVWQQYGIFMFILYVFILSYPVVKLSYLYLKYEINEMLLPLALSFYCLLLVVVSKSFTWSYAGLSIGGFVYITHWLYLNKSILNKKT